MKRKIISSAKQKELDSNCCFCLIRKEAELYFLVISTILTRTGHQYSKTNAMFRNLSASVLR